MPDREPFRVVIASSHALERLALRHALDADPRLTVVGEAATGADAVQLVRIHQPDVAVVDAGLGSAVSGAVGVCAAIKTADLGSRVVITSDECEEALLHSAVEAGADGYLPKTVDLERFVTVVRSVAAGEAFVPSHMLGSLLRRLIQRRRAAHHVFESYLELTKREREILQLLVDGLDHQQIAEYLVIAPHTARTHIQNTITKLGARSRLEAIALAVEHDLLVATTVEERGA